MEKEKEKEKKEEKEQEKEKEKEKESESETETEKEKEIISIDLDDSESDESESKKDDSLTGQEENESNEEASASQPAPEKKKVVKDLVFKDQMKFMDNFDPELSNREKRKLTRKIYTEGGRKTSTVYDENGILSGLEKDVCDCLNESCPGCHFPCAKCRSCKCGHDCRVNRKWMYELIENEGEKTVVKNTFQVS